MQIPDQIRKCVVFLAYLNKEGDRLLKGTGFFMSIPADNSRSFMYLVTARHVIANIQTKKISEDNNIWIRMNKKSGGFGFIPVPINNFINHPDSVDVTVLPFSPDQEVYDYLTLPYEMLINENILQSENIGLGDEVFMIGLFIRHFGKEKNIPIVRVGNIAAMPEEQIYTKAFGDMDGYLVELRSLGGLSGSPVFVYLSNLRTFNNGNTRLSQSHQFYLLGLLHGHWDLDSAIQDVFNEDYPTEGRNLINTGLGIAIPAFKISETLNQDYLEQNRKKILQELELQPLPS